MRNQNGCRDGCGRFKGQDSADMERAMRKACKTSSSEMLCWSTGGYCRGVMLVSQVAMAVTADRGTASANEQK